MRNPDVDPTPGRRRPRRRRFVLLALALLPLLLGAALLVSTSDGSGPAGGSPAAAAEADPAVDLAADLDEGAPLDPDDLPSGPIEESRPGLPVRSVVSGPSVVEPAAKTETGADAAATPETVGLHADDGVFWNGSFVFDGAVLDAGLCDVTGPCFVYPLEVADDGARLRVAIDTPSREDTFVVQILDPSGEVVAETTNTNQFNAEAFHDEPTAGAYSVRVLPRQVEDASFRMRAKLESEVA